MKANPHSCHFVDITHLYAAVHAVWRGRATAIRCLIWKINK